MQLKKYEKNPVLAPNPARSWESLVATNPGAWYDEEKGEVLMLYRAAGEDAEHRVNLALAVSKNGYDFHRVSEQPLFAQTPGSWDGGSIEDPRIVKMDGWYFVTYAAVPCPPGRYWLNGGRQTPQGLPPKAPFILRENETRTGLAITQDFKTIYRPGYLTDATVDDRDVIIFPEKVGGKFVTLHRPMQWVGPQYGTEAPAIWIAFSDDLLQHKTPVLLAKAQYGWEVKIGGSAPPIKTPYGWFMLYHAVGPDEQYRVGAMLLDLHDPARVTHRLPEPILVPEENYECKGIYPGICFPCGNIIMDGTLFVYYGGADQYVGVATCRFDDLLQELLKHPV